jgi:hypothetical protein
MNEKSERERNKKWKKYIERDRKINVTNMCGVCTECGSCNGNVSLGGLVVVVVFEKISSFYGVILRFSA